MNKINGIVNVVGDGFVHKNAWDRFGQESVERVYLGNIHKSHDAA